MSYFDLSSLSLPNANSTSKVILSKTKLVIGIKLWSFFYLLLYKDIQMYFHHIIMAGLNKGQYWNGFGGTQYTVFNPF
jgi:hypothetical protein